MTTSLRSKNSIVVNGIKYSVGTRIDAQDYLYNWYPARIADVDIENGRALVHFEQWSKKFDEWILFDSPRLRPLISFLPTERSITHNDPNDVDVGDIVAALWHDERHYPAVVLGKTTNTPSGQVMLSIGFEDEHRTVVHNVSANEISTGRAGRVAVVGVDSRRPPTYSPRFPDPDAGSRGQRANKRSISVPLSEKEQAFLGRVVSSLQRVIKERESMAAKGPRSPPPATKLAHYASKGSESSRSAAHMAGDGINITPTRTRKSSLTREEDNSDDDFITTSSSPPKATRRSRKSSGSSSDAEERPSIPSMTSSVEVGTVEARSGTLQKQNRSSKGASKRTSTPLKGTSSLSSHAHSPLSRSQSPISAADDVFVDQHSQPSKKGRSSRRGSTDSANTTGTGQANPPLPKLYLKVSASSSTSSATPSRKASRSASTSSSNSHPCEHCPKVCATARGLTMHMQYNHPELVEDIPYAIKRALSKRKGSSFAESDREGEPVLKHSKSDPPYNSSLASQQPTPMSTPPTTPSHKLARQHSARKGKKGKGKRKKKSKEESRDDEEVLIRCICGFDTTSEFMIECETCRAWQHSDCVGAVGISVAAAYSCYICEKSRNEMYDKLKKGPLSSIVQPEMLVSANAAKDQCVPWLDVAKGIMHYLSEDLTLVSMCVRACGLQVGSLPENVAQSELQSVIQKQQLLNNQLIDLLNDIRAIEDMITVLATDPQGLRLLPSEQTLLQLLHEKYTKQKAPEEPVDTEADSALKENLERTLQDMVADRVHGRDDSSNDVFIVSPNTSVSLVRQLGSTPAPAPVMLAGPALMQAMPTSVQPSSSSPSLSSPSVSTLSSSLPAATLPGGVKNPVQRAMATSSAAATQSSRLRAMSTSTT